MKYKCKSVSIFKLTATHKGFFTPLCESCKTIDCTNSIEKRKVSILGINKEMKVLTRDGEFAFVVNCEGFSK